MKPAGPVTLSPAQDWLRKYGDRLYRYAYYRIHDSSAAEDLVQETLIAALKGRQNFAGRSSESTWLVGILKNKIVDYLRKAMRERTFEYTEELQDDIEREYFDSAGHWKAAPSIWQQPETAMEQSEFWDIFNDCVDAIPDKQAEIFKLCEIDGLSAKQVSKVLQITPTNIWVALHRARLKLRDCMHKRWFNGERSQ